MNIKRAVALQFETVARIADCYSAARSFALTHQALMERKQAVRASLPKTTPGWVKSYIDGYDACLLSHTIRDQLVYGAWSDGRFYSNDKHSPDYVETQGITWQAFGGMNPGLYWKHNTARPF
jgi:hypothetical protein